MKLVTELIETVDVRVQIDEETKQKSHFLEGVFLQSELKNRNGRMYPMAVSYTHLTLPTTPYV